MKQKTFELDGELARAFESFCRQRMLIEKRAAAAALLRFMELSTDEREAAILRLSRWLEGDHSLPDTSRSDDRLADRGLTESRGDGQA